jgi:hypothetical protein
MSDIELPGAPEEQRLPTTEKGSPTTAGVPLPGTGAVVSPTPPPGADAITAAVGPAMPVPKKRVPPPHAIPLTPQRPTISLESMRQGVEKYASTVSGQVPGEPTATSSYALMRTRQGQNALAAAVGQPLLYRPSVAMNVIVDGETYNVEVSEDGTFISGSGLLQDVGGGVRADTLSKVLEKIKQKAMQPESPLSPWAKGQIARVTADNPQPIQPADVALAERVAKDQIRALAQNLGGGLPNLTALVKQMESTGEVFRSIFFQEGASQRYGAAVYGPDLHGKLQESVLGGVRSGLEVAHSRDIGQVAAVVKDAVTEPFDEIGGEDFHDGAELSSKPTLQPLGEKDKALGFSRTREAATFREPWYVDGKPVAQETIQVLETRKRAEAGIKKALKELEGCPGDKAEIRRTALQKMLRTVDRNQSFLHASGLRETVTNLTQRVIEAEKRVDKITKALDRLKDRTDEKGETRRAALQKELGELDRFLSKVTGLTMEQRVGKLCSEIAVDRIAFAEPPNLVKDSVVVAGTGKKFDIIRVGAFSDHLNSAVSLKLLYNAVEGQEAAKVQIKAIRERLRTRLATEKLTEPQQAVLQHMIGQLAPENLKKTLLERREILRQQALQLVATQVGEAGEHLEGMSKLHVAHTSLLFPGKDSWDISGIGLNEQRMIEDMEQIFSEMDGKEIHLDRDLEAPYIDAERTIHVPRPTGVRQAAVTLATHYVNVSAAHTLSEEVATGQRMLGKNTLQTLDDEITGQKTTLWKIHAEAGAQLERAGTDGSNAEARAEVQNIEQRLSDILRAESLLRQVKKELEGTTTHKTAAMLIEVEKIVGWYPSTGCYSDKDRGGLAGRTVLTNMVAHSMQDGANILEQQVAAAEEKGDTKATDRLSEEAHQLQIRAKKLIDDNPYAAFSPDSCQMQVTQHVVKKPQHYLKTWLGVKGAAKIAKVCLPLIARPRLGRVREGLRRAARKVMAHARLRVRGSDQPPSPELELL